MRKDRLLLLLLFSILVFSHQNCIAQTHVIRPGDSIEILVYGHQELSRIVIVSPNGTIDFPFMQNIPIDGMTLDELRKFMAAQLAQFLDGQPVVTVGFTESQFIKVVVLGHVKKPGTLQLPLSGTLQEAISQAGGPLEGANMQDITVLRNELDELKKKSYNLEFLNLKGDLSQNPLLKDQDVILVTGNPIFAGVKVVGAVNDPGIHQTFYGANLMDLIFKAGGFTDKANPRKIRYIPVSQAESKEIKVNIEEYYKDPASYGLPKVQPGDLIIVAEQTEWFRRTISIAADLASISSIIYYITLTNRYRNN